MRAILMYHSIDSSGSPISLAAETFEAHVRWFRSGRVRVCTIDDLLSAPDDDDDAVAITFDDGFANIAERAIPALIDAGLPSTVFIVSGHVGGTNAWGGVITAGIPDLPLLTWDALGRLAESRVTLGAHTRTHPNLTTLDPGQLRDELEGSADAIARETGRRPAIFAYPYGAYSDLTSEFAGTAFRWSCTTDFRVVESDAASSRLPRLDAYYFQRPGAFEAFGTAGFGAWVRRRDRLRRARRFLWRH
jgi:peptidoglycan/xylan/chitin deacetylase (PgdA/CDA1 family)